MSGEIGANHNAVGLEENCWRDRLPTSKGPEVEFVEAATEPPKLGLGTETLF